jgi:hypothetical protein
MNIRKIKLALTVGLMNLDAQGNALQAVREVISDFKEAGAFLDLRKLKAANLNTSHVSETYALQFENCTVALDVVSNPNTRSQFVQSFRLN